MLFPTWIDRGHKTGPHRTSCDAIRNYELVYNNPFGPNSYQSNGFKKENGTVQRATPTYVSPNNIANLEAVDLPVYNQADPETDPKTVPEVITITKDEYNTIKKQGASWDERCILDIVRQYKPGLAEKVEKLKRLQITESKEDNDTYHKRITDFVRAANENKKYTLGTGKVKDDMYQIFLDKRDNRIIVSIFYGSKQVVKTTACS